LLDLAFTNFGDIDISFPDSGIIKPDTYHPPMVIGINLPLVSPTEICDFSYHKYTSGDYTLLYNILLIMTGLVCMAPVL
jgi:hypothetical protein